MELLKTELVPGDPMVLLLQGEADFSTTDQLRTALERALSADSTIVVDMAGITFIDAAGLRAVLRAAAARNGRGAAPTRQRGTRRAVARDGGTERLAFD